MDNKYVVLHLVNDVDVVFRHFVLVDNEGVFHRLVVVVVDFVIILDVVLHILLVVHVAGHVVVHLLVVIVVDCFFLLHQ